MGVNTALKALRRKDKVAWNPRARQSRVVDRFLPDPAPNPTPSELPGQGMTCTVSGKTSETPRRPQLVQQEQSFFVFALETVTSADNWLSWPAKSISELAVPVPLG